jgi:hypothetical protein
MAIALSLQFGCFSAESKGVRDYPAGYLPRFISNRHDNNSEAPGVCSMRRRRKVVKISEASSPSVPPHQRCCLYRSRSSLQRSLYPAHRHNTRCPRPELLPMLRNHLLGQGRGKNQPHRLKAPRSHKTLGSSETSEKSFEAGASALCAHSPQKPRGRCR